MKKRTDIFFKGLRWTVPWLVLAGCAHSKDQLALTPEKKSEAQAIAFAESTKIPQGLVWVRKTAAHAMAA